MLLGILFLVFGAVKLAGFFSKDPYQLVFESDLVFGILYLALGLLLLLRPAHTMAFFGIVFGLMLLADGLTRVRIALDAPPFGIRAWWLILVSAIATAFSASSCCSIPARGTQVLTQLLGISLMVDGVMNISTILAAVRVIRARPVPETTARIMNWSTTDPTHNPALKGGSSYESDCRRLRRFLYGEGVGLHR